MYRHIEFIHVVFIIERIIILIIIHKVQEAEYVIIIIGLLR